MLKVVGASWYQTRVSTCIVGAVSALGILAVILGEIDRWAMLEVETRDEYPDWVQAYSAGLLEGSLTWQLIHWHWQNTVQNMCQYQVEFCKQVRSFVEINSGKIKDLAEKRGNSDPFWHQVQLFYVQLDGLETGWRHGVKRSRHEIDISHLDFLWMNMVSDLADMEHTFNGPLEDTRFPFVFSTAASFSSAFVKFRLETGELFAAHNSGGLYQSMLRVLKRYQLGYHRTSDRDSFPVPGQIITFSSYPGVIHSQDDFYLVAGGLKFGKKQHQLAVLGTAFSYNNRTLSSFDQKEQVLVGPRVMAANRLAKGSRFWGCYLEQANSGTGSKQWLIVDYGQIMGLDAVNSLHVDKKVASKLLSNLQPKQQNAVKKARAPVGVKRGLLWVVEQTPEHVHYADQTRMLQQTGFWVSDGHPYYQDTSHTNVKTTAGKSGMQAFHDDQLDATTVISVMQLMRNNTFLSSSHPSLQNGSSSSFSSNLPPMGTIDSKILKASPFQKVELHVISGPPVTYIESNKNNCSADIMFLDIPFQWSKSQFANETHIGLPDLWQFNAVQPEWFWV
ncbi:putative phospholipase B-like lamina ancestor isoform X2 [Zootermopsis nevadensis]|uniref:putative phospholipase B-like lamina ancestor isoform X2 n=1 Tax=Zootermopsis nevadensis TaxID=136037 RepID=UPI000B8E3257|nr:putative phospholipase B-like lamina ancestor isoform X2 [Zootermopsis nevadensis]